MCPPAERPPPAEIGLYWSDEQIISLLDKYTPGSRLPDNVLADSIPYQYPPSNLPEGIWYIVNSNERKESVHGFWRAKGEACDIYSNSMISGWRTTLEYFEGQAPHGQRTDWLMQEYRVTKKDVSDKDKPTESRLLCRVFRCSGLGSKSDMHLKKCKTIIESKKINVVASIDPNTNITAGLDSKCESKDKGECEVEVLPPVADNKTDPSRQVFSELECFSRGDFLELNDLEDPESHSSSSQNSSCPSKLSDEYFDSSAFLRDLEEEEKKYMQSQRSSLRYSFPTSVRSNDVVLPPASSGSVLSGSLGPDKVEGSRSGSVIQEKSTNEHTTKRQNSDSTTEGSTSSSHGGGTPPSSCKNAGPSGSKKACSGRIKKLKLYFCFASF